MFESIEQRINSGALSKLSNATALINAVEIRGIFDNETTDDGLGLAGFQSTAPQFTCATADVADVQEGDQAVIRGATYRVSEIEPDGSGMTVLILKK